MNESNAVLPGPPCGCECDGCEIGYHCGVKPHCENPVWENVEPRLRKQESERDYLEKRRS